jgi:hypothetical protein
MNKEFAAFEGRFDAATTRRVYLSAAKGIHRRQRARKLRIIPELLKNTRQRIWHPTKVAKSVEIDPPASFWFPKILRGTTGNWDTG